MHNPKLMFKGPNGPVLATIKIQTAWRRYSIQLLQLTETPNDYGNDDSAQVQTVPTKKIYKTENLKAEAGVIQSVE